MCMALCPACGDRFPSGYALIMPQPPKAWVSFLGEPHWRVEWLDPDGQKQTADVRPGKSMEVEVPKTWASPVSAWPHWPSHNITPGHFKPAGAFFPFDVSGDSLSLSWEAGPATVYYWELAYAAEQDSPRIPSNFDWPRFREIFQDEKIKEAVRKDPWLVDWRTVAEKTIKSGFDKRRLVPEVRESMLIPVPSGPWYGTSPFAQSLYFPVNETPVFPVRSDIDVWISGEGILRCNRNAWFYHKYGQK